MKKIIFVILIFLSTICYPKGMDKYIGKTFFNKNLVKSNKLKNTIIVNLIELKINKENIEIKIKKFDLVDEKFNSKNIKYYQNYEKNIEVKKYKYKLLNNKIIVNAHIKNINNKKYNISYLELKDDKIIANFKYPNGKIGKKVFKEKFNLEIEKINNYSDKVFNKILNKFFFSEADEEALLGKNYKKINKNETFYSQNAMYVFEIGGGCFTPEISSLSVELENNIVNIIWQQPNKPCPKVGKYGAFKGKIIFNKKKFPNCRKFKFNYQYK